VGDSVVSHRITFEFDKAFLSDEAMAIIAYHAEYLADNPDATAIIQGNASSPGSHQYNYELGLERAQAVAQALINLGASDNQLLITSTGKLSHTEANAQAVVIAY
jgi:outer membrane protein OmpA-like peptidoglycan-associated protein